MPKKNNAVNAYLERKRKDGFRTLSLIVHEDDAEAVRDFANQLRAKRESDMQQLTPESTLKVLKSLPINDHDFRRLHHLKGSKKDSETIESHLSYLSPPRQRYQTTKNNYTLAERLHSVANSIQSGNSKEEAINKAIAEFPYKA
jgi:hypothetical protein